MYKQILPDTISYELNIRPRKSFASKNPINVIRDLMKNNRRRY